MGRPLGLGRESRVLNRRSLLAALALPAFGAGKASAAPPSLELELFAGTYQAEGGKGLVRLAFQPQTDWAQTIGYLPIDNASYGLASRRTGARYLVNESDQGAVGCYDRSWMLARSTSSGGASPCFLALDARERCLAVANYGSGSVALIRLDPADGRPMGSPQVVAHQGSGPVRERQAGPHAHWVGFSPDQAWLHAIDLGSDTIFAHPFDGDGGRLGEGQIAYAAPPGSGPRHMVRHPALPLAYLVSELANTLTVLTVRDGGRFDAAQTLTTLPPGFSGHSQAAHIAIDAAGRRLYLSNRGANTLAVFALDAAGRPSLLQQIACGGDWPRFFRLMEGERRLLVANERSGAVAIFHLLADGRLRDSDRRIIAPGVVFLMT